MRKKRSERSVRISSCASSASGSNPQWIAAEWTGEKRILRFTLVNSGRYRSVNVMIHWDLVGFSAHSVRMDVADAPGSESRQTPYPRGCSPRLSARTAV